VLNADVAVDRRDFTVRVALQVANGERVALFGPSGAGKTTVLEAIAGLIAPRTARVEVAGRLITSTAPPVVSVPPWRRGVGMLRQDPGLFPHLSVRANLLYARSARAARGELDALARALGIEELLDEMPARLSGGQRHRVALGRLLLARCDALLLDEPFASLDAALRRTLTTLVASLTTERAIPSVLVTHQLQDAQAFADRFAVIDAGVVLQEGAPDEVVLRPASRRAAELLGYLGFVPVPGPADRAGTGADPAAESATAGTAGVASGGGVVAGVHPERVIPGADPARGLVVTGTVTAARPSGAGWEADVLAGGAAFTCRLPDEPPRAGLSVTLLDPPYFGPDGAALTDPVATSARPAGS
jgi:ABC-type sugar transport system ATPase subunit